MITHDVDEAILLSDRILLMSNGNEVNGQYAPGGLAEVVQNPLPRDRTAHNCTTCLVTTICEITLWISWFRAPKRINFQFNFFTRKHMNRLDVTEKIISTKVSKGIKWSDVADKVGLSKEWVTAACLGQMTLDAKQAKIIGKIFGLTMPKSKSGCKWCPTKALCPRLCPPIR
jgi:energy-coupling factor transporter ATP-binding protein EcfA2